MIIYYLILYSKIYGNNVNTLHYSYFHQNRIDFFSRRFRANIFFSTLIIFSSIQLN